MPAQNKRQHGRKQGMHTFEEEGMHSHMPKPVDEKADSPHIWCYVRSNYN